MWPPRATMSSGWVRRPDVAAPVPFGLKVCFSVSPKAICLTVSVLGALEVAPALGEVVLELEHPAAPSRPAATTVAPSQVAVRRLRIFTKRSLCDPSDARRSGIKAASERPMAKSGPNAKNLVNARLLVHSARCHPRTWRAETPRRRRAAAGHRPSLSGCRVVAGKGAEAGLAAVAAGGHAQGLEQMLEAEPDHGRERAASADPPRLGQL